MGRKTYEFNPESGTYYEIEDDANGDLVIRTMQDVEPVLEYCKELRNSGYQDRGIKEEWWRYAVVPAAIWLKMKDEGYDIFNPEQTKECFQYINKHYPHFKTTYLNHE